MILDEAIRVNKILETNPFDSKWKEAIQLGIEALERVKDLREKQNSITFMIYSDMAAAIKRVLPSETEKRGKHG